jgi:hypothetical protein
MLIAARLKVTAVLDGLNAKAWPQAKAAKSPQAP